MTRTTASLAYNIYYYYVIYAYVYYYAAADDDNEEGESEVIYIYVCTSLTDSEATLQAINKWIGGGAKLSLARRRRQTPQMSSEPSSL
jgi:hypothetical protein